MNRYERRKRIRRKPAAPAKVYEKAQEVKQ